MNKNWIKYMVYFIIGYFIFTLLSSITLFQIIKNVEVETNLGIIMDFKTTIFNTMKSGTLLYSVIFLIIIILNVLYNIRLAKKLNEKSRRIRKISNERVLKERRSITMKRKIFISILVILLIIVILFIGDVSRKFFIIKDIEKNVEKYSNSSNYEAKMYTYEGDGVNIVTSLVKDEKSLATIKLLRADNDATLIYYKDGDTKHTFYESEDEKIATLNVDILPTPVQILNNFKDGTFQQILSLAVTTKITTEECNGKECYKFDYGMNCTYFEKETGLIIREFNGTSTKENGEVTNLVTDYRYEFNNVKDEDIIEPDISKYTIQQK